MLSAHHLTIVGKTKLSISCQFSILVYSQLVSCGRKQLFEEALKSCNNLSSIRTLGTHNPNLEGKFLDALAPMKALLQGNFICLQLKDHNFDTFEAASKLEMDELWGNILAVDETLTTETTTKDETQKKERFQDFLQQHAQCEEVQHPSSTCKPPRLPKVKEWTENSVVLDLVLSVLPVQT